VTRVSGRFRSPGARPRAILASLLLLSACAPPDESVVHVDLDRQEMIQFRGGEYTTIRRGINLEESELIPIGTATLTHTRVVDSSVWALPGVDPAKLIVLRTPPGFDEPGWIVGDFVYFTRMDIVGAIPEACPFFADPTPGCLNMYPSPSAN
jgi:hypothetical protein